MREWMRNAREINRVNKKKLKLNVISYFKICLKPSKQNNRVLGINLTVKESIMNDMTTVSINFQYFGGMHANSTQQFLSYFFVVVAVEFVSLSLSLFIFQMGFGIWITGNSLDDWRTCNDNDEYVCMLLFRILCKCKCLCVWFVMHISCVFGCNNQVLHFFRWYFFPVLCVCFFCCVRAGFGYFVVINTTEAQALGIEEY